MFILHLSCVLLPELPTAFLSWASYDFRVLFEDLMATLPPGSWVSACWLMPYDGQIFPPLLL